MNRKARLFIVSLLAGAFLSLSAAALAETVLWKWVDNKGNVHYVEYKSQVPEKYRDKAEKVVIKGKSDGGGKGEAVKETPPAPPEKKKAEKSESYTEWEEKAYSAYMTVKDLESQVSGLEPRCAELRRKSILMPIIKNQQASAECFDKLQNLKDLLEKNRKYVDDGIYKEAMRAGIPLDAVKEGIEKAKRALKKKK